MGGIWSRRQGRNHSSSCGYGSQSASSSSYSPYATHNVQPDVMGRLKKRYSKIDDNYNSLEQVTDALLQAGLESSNLIVGIDFTKSNEWTGRVSFNRQSLHDIGQLPNPYEQALSIIGRTLSAFDEDNLIPCFGFGDVTTHDREVFSFYPDNRPCNGFEEALARYREIVPHLRLSGPTSFTPIIETAISIVDNSGGQYHVLLIIADGQVTRSVDTPLGSLSSQERDTINAIVKASEYPLSIVLVGVGDGPWDMMRQFDDNIPSRAFDNFQFVNFTEIMCKSIPSSKKETEFALASLMEIPSQYKATLELQLLGQRKGTQVRFCLPPPVSNSNSRSSSFNRGSGGQKDASCPPSGKRYQQDSKIATYARNS
uniref:E3 ubiquitin-protein ligase RGLG2 n=1 Tax=Anthurium amnicola TaxID=1678845 RepID=A0A1D1YLP3_9ARAE